MIWLAIGLIAFHGFHSIRMIAPDWREARIASMGQFRWRLFHSVFSLTSFALFVWGYDQARSDSEILYMLPMGLTHVALSIMALSLILLMIFAFPPGKLKPAIKYPVLLAVIFWSIAHLLVNGDTASILLFGSFLISAMWNIVDIIYRNEPVVEGGPIRNDVIAVVSGIALWAIIVWKAHQWIIGVSPIA